MGIGKWKGDRFFIGLMSDMNKKSSTNALQISSENIYYFLFISPKCDFKKKLSLICCLFRDMFVVAFILISCENNEILLPNVC
jgi:hypothetical protein